MIRRLCILPLLGLLALGYAEKCPDQQTSPGREILCYTSTNDPKSLQETICKCTTIIHQGHDLLDLSLSGVEELQKSLKELNPVLQFVLSVNDNSETLKTSANVRLEATARIVRLLNEVDGIELNVTAGSKERLVHFVQGISTELVRKSKEKRILLALPTKPQDLAKHFDLKALSKYVDLFTIPTHYLSDDDEAFRTFHPSRLMGIFDMLNTDSLVDLITGLGAEKGKILVTLPAGAYKFTLRNKEENAPRAPTTDKQPARIGSVEMCEYMEKGEWIVERDEDLTAPYAFKDNTWIAFEDGISAGIKGKYVMLRDLAGLGIQDVDKDSKTNCGKSVTEEIYNSFTDNKRKTREVVLASLHDDLQKEPNSYPDHVKSSDFRIVRIVDSDGHVHASRENVHTEFSCPRQGYFVHPKSCNRFYRCVKFNQGVEDYSVFEFDCPAGLAFDERTEVCVWPGSITEGGACPGSSEIAPAKGEKFTCPDHPGYYADPQNCRFFYACYDLGEHELIAYEFRCPYGLVFDEDKLICEWPYLVPSCGGTTYHKEYPGYPGGGHAGPIGGHVGWHGDAGSSGHSGSGHEEHGEGHEHGHGDYDESGHGGHEDGHEEHGGYDESGHEKGHGEHGGYGHDEGHGGHGGYDESGHENGHGEHGGHGDTGHDEGHGGHGGYDESGHEGGHEEHGDYDDIGHGKGHEEHGGYDETGHGGHEEGHDEGGYDHGHTTIHSGHDEHKHTTIHSEHEKTVHTPVYPIHDHTITYTPSYPEHDHKGHTPSYPGHGQTTHTPVYPIHDHTVHTPIYPVHEKTEPTPVYPVHEKTEHTPSYPVHEKTEHTPSYPVHENTEHTPTYPAHDHTVHDHTVHTPAYPVHDHTVYTPAYPVHDQTGHTPSYPVHEQPGHTQTYPVHDQTGHTPAYPIYGHTTIHSGYENEHSGHTTQSGHDENVHGTVHGGSDEGHSTIHSGHGHESSGEGHTTQSVHIGGGHSIDTGYEGVGHADGHSTVYSDHSIGVGTKEVTDSDYEINGGHVEYTTLDKGIIAGIPSSGHDGHTPEIQYDAPTGVTASHEIDHSAGFSRITGQGSTNYQGNFGLNGNSGYYYSNKGSSSSAGIRGGGYKGGISSGSANQGFAGTADSTSGTVYTHGDVSGTVLTGSSKQGQINSGLIQPGYVQSNFGSPGYVVSNGVKTTYNYDTQGSLAHGYGSNGVVLTGPQSPGIVLTGHPSSGTYNQGQTSSGVLVGGGVRPGNSIITSPQNQYNHDGMIVSKGQGFYNTALRPSSPNKNPFLVINEDKGYKTNEYHDNGGRSTIRYNNGEVTHKYTEEDVRQHQMQFGTLPKFDVQSYKVTPGAFTKTGPTKTGITTAQLGGSASYVAASPRPRPSVDAEKIGANAFSGHSEMSNAVTLTSQPAVSYTTTKSNYAQIDSSKISLGSIKTSNEGSGYSYAKPAIQLHASGISSSTVIPPSRIQQNIPVYPTSPAPFLDVQVYNPSSVSSSPVTSSPQVGPYRPSGSFGEHISSRPVHRRPFPSSTISPIGFTTGPVENFKTTVFEAAKIPVAISTVQPVIDTGYKTVISSTKYPVNLQSGGFGFNQNSGYKASSVSMKDNSAIDINVSFQPHLPSNGEYDVVAPAVGIESTGYEKTRRPVSSQSVIYKQPTVSKQNGYGSSGSAYTETSYSSDYNYGQSGTFGKKISQSSVTPAVYQNPIITPSEQIYNVRTSTIAPAIGVTFRQPFQISTSRPRVPSNGYEYSKPSIKFVNTTPSIKYKDRNEESEDSSRKPEIPRKEVQKLITNYNRGSTKFVPSGYETYDEDRDETTSKSFGYSNQRVSEQSSFSRASSSPNFQAKTVNRDFGNRVTSSKNSEIYREDFGTSTYPSVSKIPAGSRKPLLKNVSTFGPTVPSITTYSGSYGRISSTPSYESSTLKKQKGRGKVVVKLSDLHPLLLGKLGAECTCKADPFEALRSGKPLAIDSSRGQVDLSNYDESEIYVDLESSKENNGDYSGEYVTSLRKSTKPESRKFQTPIIAVFDTVATSPRSEKVQRPSSAYLPVSSTNSPQIASRALAKNDVSLSPRGFRAGKNLRDSKESNVLVPDRPGGISDFDESLQGNVDCARPGLFRHPKHCNKFYACHWDDWKKKFTLHVFNCPVHLTFDSAASACNWPSKGPACQDDNLLV